ncbi:MAG TPA: SDR family oxidoreductase [Candidatus Krumholzibacteria bacterium]|nr:SDR family oxidoreductase [Candidatus Krumholzibacteria bacterium]
MNIDLKDTRALVTGASRGIGKAIAMALMDSGARVVVHYRTEREAAQALVSPYEGSTTLAADLNDPRQCVDLFRRAEDALGGINLLVNNAGIAIPSSLDSGDDWVADWERTMRVNLTASAILTREAILAALSRGDLRIVYIGSRAAFRGDTPDYLAYAASKGGLTSLARSIARGYGKQGVRSFVVAPGFTRTEMAEDFIRAYGEDYAMKDIALDRMTEPRDIAPLVVFLASGLADHATGTSIDVNAASYVR